MKGRGCTKCDTVQQDEGRGLATHCDSTSKIKQLGKRHFKSV